MSGYVGETPEQDDDEYDGIPLAEVRARLRGWRVVEVYGGYLAFPEGTVTVEATTKDRLLSLFSNMPV